MDAETNIVERQIDVNALVNFSATQAGLAELRQKHEGFVFDCTIKSQDAEARKARKSLVSLRGDVESQRKAIKGLFIEAGKKVDIFAKEITAAITALEDPIDAQIKVEEGRKASIKLEADRIEYLRVEDIKIRIMAIESWAVRAIRLTAEELEKVIIPEIDETFAEFADQARGARLYALGAVERVHTLRVVQDAEERELKASRAKLEIERTAMAAQRQAETEAIEAERTAMAAQRQAEAAALDAERKAASDSIAEAHRALAALHAEEAGNAARLLAEAQAQLQAERAAIEAERAEQLARINREHEQKKALAIQQQDATNQALACLQAAAPVMLETLFKVEEFLSETLPLNTSAANELLRTVSMAIQSARGTL